MNRILALLVLALAAVALRARAVEPARAARAWTPADPHQDARPAMKGPGPVWVAIEPGAGPERSGVPAMWDAERPRPPRSSLRVVRFRQRVGDDASGWKSAEPSLHRRFGPPMDLLPSASRSLVDRLAWALTAVTRSSAELRSARGRQSDP